MYRLPKPTGALALVLGMIACSQPEPDKQPGLTLSASLRNIDDQGQTSTLRVSATDDREQPGTGTVELTASAGLLDTDQKSVTLTLADGVATVPFKCPKAQDAACKGAVTLEATWNQTTARMTVQVGSSTSNEGDGGTSGDGDPTDGGTGGGSGSLPTNIVFLSSGSKSQIGIRSSGLDTSTPVTFVVTDLANNRLPKVTVNFSVSGPAGVKLSAASARTDDQGQATALLESGDEVGVATVTARVTLTSGITLSVSSLGTPIVGARTSDEGFVVECDQLNLAANATDTPPRKDLGTDCKAKLVDRFENPVTLATSVSWYSEAGSIQNPSSTTAGGTGVATTTFSTAGKWPPVPVSPLTAAESEEAEPAIGSYNPRDMLVTLIAVTTGEEEFYDGSGLSRGEKDGKWNPGEWFVDVPEPFVDANDNQVYDPGEAFIDTERLDCATGLRQPKNNKWDGPNGCWDGDIMLWRPTHIVYSGFNTREPARWTMLVGSAPPPYTIPKGGSALINVTVTDAYLNRMAPNGATIEMKKLGTRGSGEMVWVDPFINTRTYGFQLLHERVEVTPDSSQPRGYAVVGLCDPGKVPPAGASTDPRLARCVRQYRFGQFGFDNAGGVGLKGASATDTGAAETYEVWVTARNSDTAATASVRVTMQ